MKKHDKLSLSSDEMKSEKAGTRGDHLKCPYPGTDALNCDYGSTPVDYIRRMVNGVELSIGLKCSDSQGNITELYCSGYGSGSGSGSGTIKNPDNDVDACAGLSVDAVCSWSESGTDSNGNPYSGTYSGTCQYSQSKILYCKKA